MLGRLTTPLDGGPRRDRLRERFRRQDSIIEATPTTEPTSAEVAAVSITMNTAKITPTMGWPKRRLLPYDLRPYGPSRTPVRLILEQRLDPGFDDAATLPTLQQFELTGSHRTLPKLQKSSPCRERAAIG